MFRTLLAVLIVVAFLFVTGWVLWRWMQKSEDDPPKLIFKWVLSAILCAGIGFYALKANDGFGQIAAILGAAVVGLIMAILWAPNFTAWVARPFAALYDGGDLEADPQPLYAMAEARRKRGDYPGASEEIRRQLAMFPADLQGHLMLAEIQAEHESDVAAAATTIWGWLSAQESPQPGGVALALNRLADWQLHLAKQPDAARGTLEHLVRLIPESDHAQMAIQRIGHLPTAAGMAARDSREAIAVPHLPGRLGLASPPAKPADSDAARAKAEPDEETPWLQQLEAFPQDHEARERLAHLYLNERDRPDLALDQVRALLEQPSQSERNVVRWLNLLADIHVRQGDEASARAVLEQVTARVPESALAEQARQRLARVGVEIRAQKKSQTVKLGSYEKNVGLKVKA